MTKNTDFVVLNRYDKAGIICSGACAIHCLLLPIFAYASPFIAEYLSNEWIHITILVILFPIAGIAFYRTQKIHKKVSPIILGSLGIVLLISAVLSETLHIEIPYLEKILTGIGSMLLIIGHLMNIRYLKKN